MGFIGESRECLKRSHSFINGFFEVAAQQRPVDVAFECFYQRISGDPGNEIRMDIEAGRGEQTRKGFERRTALGALYAGDDGLGCSSPAGQVSLSQARPGPRFMNQPYPIVASVHTIMIAS